MGMVLAGYATGSVSLALAAALITGGGLLAAKDLFAKPKDATATTPAEPTRSP